MTWKACANREGADFLIRATQNRCLESSSNHLKEEMELVEPQVTMTVALKHNQTHQRKEGYKSLKKNLYTMSNPFDDLIYWSGFISPAEETGFLPKNTG